MSAVLVSTLLLFGSFSVTPRGEESPWTMPLIGARKFFLNFLAPLIYSMINDMPQTTLLVTIFKKTDRVTSYTACRMTNHHSKSQPQT